MNNKMVKDRLDKLTELGKLHQEHSGELILIDNEVLQFVAIAENKSETELYYVLYDGKDLIFKTYNSHIVLLLGVIKDVDYTRFCENSYSFYSQLINRTPGYSISEYTQHIISHHTKFKIMSDIDWTL